METITTLSIATIILLIWNLLQGAGIRRRKKDIKTISNELKLNRETINKLGEELTKTRYELQEFIKLQNEIWDMKQ